MQFRPARIIRVPTGQELDSAVGSADQVIVEGDDQLLSYAVTKASNDPLSRIAVEIWGRSISVGADAIGPVGTAGASPAPQRRVDRDLDGPGSAAPLRP